MSNIPPGSPDDPISPHTGLRRSEDARPAKENAKRVNPLFTESQKLRQLAFKPDQARERALLQRISDTVHAGGKFKVLSPNQKRILRGDVVVQTKGDVRNPCGIIAVFRPVIPPMSAREVLAEARRIDGFDVYAPGETKPTPGDVLFCILDTDPYPHKPVAILRQKSE